MVTKEEIIKAFAGIQNFPDKLEEVFQSLNSNNKALKFELALHDLLKEHLKSGITFLEIYGAFESVKAYIQNDFNKANDRIKAMQQMHTQIQNENQHGNN